MDNNSISILKDYQTSIEKSFNKIDSKINSYSKATKAEKKAIKNIFETELKHIDKNIKLMEAEYPTLKIQENMDKWEETISSLKSNLKKYNKKINNLDTIPVEEPEIVNHLDVDAKVDLNQLNAQQVMDRGDEIVKEDKNIISGMVKTVHGDVGTMKEVNIKLNEQNEKLENADADLKEIDFSIDRARRKITSMFKLYASDKCITCLIVVILIIIVTIIIVSACGGDNKKNFNVPHDIFGNNIKNNTDSNSTSSFACNLTSKFNILNLISLILLYLS